MAFHKAKALQDAEKSVAAGKISQAIKLYQEILDNDPSDVSLLNTVGDLYIRDRNITEGLRQFHKLAEAYVRDGFNVKAIAIYRKISKVDPNTVDVLLKLAELYQLQGLSREAREQYLQATEFFKRRNQPERALEVFRRVVQLDPENLNFRTRLATECEQAGKREDAAQAYLETAEIFLRREDQASAESALKKAAEMDPKNSRIQMTRARAAIARQHPDEALHIINSSPELQAEPAGKKILLDCYLAARKLPEAEALVLEVFHSNPADFAPIASVSALLVEKGDAEEAFTLVSGVAGTLISQNNAAALLEALRQIWNAAPQHIPTMELIHQLCERTADESTLPVVLEALGHAYEDSGDLEKAEAAYLKLTEREPENESFHGLLNAIQRKLGREIKPVDFSSKEMALATEEETIQEPAAVDAQQEAMVKEALENGDLFSRYNLIEKAIAELEKVLQFYPDQVEIHRRILEISRKGYPERAAAAAAQLARIFASHGDQETASKYEAIASAKGALHEIPLPAPPPAVKRAEAAVPAVTVPATAPAPAPAPVSAEMPESEKTAEFAISPIPIEEPEQAVAAPLPESISFDLTVPETPAAAPPPAPSEPATELDLSGELEAMGFASPAPPAPEPQAAAVEEFSIPLEIVPPAEAPAFIDEPATPPVMRHIEEAVPPVEGPSEMAATAPEPVEEAVPADLEDSRIEVEFYLENGFIEEAKRTFAALEAKYPGSQCVAELRQQLNERLGVAAPAAPTAQSVPADEVTIVEEPPAEEAPMPEAQAPELTMAEPEAAELAMVETPAEAATPEPLTDEVIFAEPSSQPPTEEVTMAESSADEVSAEAPPAEFELPEAAAESESSEEVVMVEPEGDAESADSAHEEWELPTSYATESEPEAAADLGSPNYAAEAVAPTEEASVSTPPPAPQPVAEEPVAAEGPGMDMLGELAGDFAASLDGMAVPESTETRPPASLASAPGADAGEGAAQLSGLLAEMEEPGGAAAAAAKDDPETHYNLGVAFREMGLLDEAIGEFQKVVKGGGKGSFPPNFLQACSLLAICFMEKKMPAIAAKWYMRALETPGLDDEATLALQYDLGIAYEQSGDSRNALERFTEVYSQNIDFRDVADKIRELQQKA